MTIAPSNTAESRLRALQLFQQGKYRESLAVLQGLCASEPFDSEAHDLLGSVYLQLSEYSKAENCFLQILSRQPAHAHACYGLGMAVGAQGNVNEASKYLKRSLEINPNNTDVRVRLGALQQMLGQHYDAMGPCRWAVNQDPDHLEAHIRLW